MRIRSIAALVLLAIFSAPLAASAITASPAPVKAHKKAVNSTVPGTPGFTGSSPGKGKAPKAKKMTKKM